jgi:hypothetical protein
MESNGELEASVKEVQLSTLGVQSIGAAQGHDTSLEYCNYY